MLLTNIIVPSLQFICVRWEWYLLEILVVELYLGKGELFVFNIAYLLLYLFRLQFYSCLQPLAFLKQSLKILNSLAFSSNILTFCKGVAQRCSEQHFSTSRPQVVKNFLTVLHVFDLLNLLNDIKNSGESLYV